MCWVGMGCETGFGTLCAWNGGAEANAYRMGTRLNVLNEREEGEVELTVGISKVGKIESRDSRSFPSTLGSNIYDMVPLSL